MTSGQAVMHIESVEESDKPSLIAIVNACMEEIVEVPEADKSPLLALIRSNIEHWHNTRDCVFLKALLASEPTGFILVKRYRKLTELFVQPDKQGLGIGTALLKAALKECAANSQLSGVMVNAALSATGFYAHNGFVDAPNEAHAPAFVSCMEYRFP